MHERDLPRQHPAVRDINCPDRKARRIRQKLRMLSLTITAAMLIAQARVPACAQDVAKKADLAGAKQQFGELCARCHGPQGFGNGPDGSALATKPRNFHDCALMAHDTDEQMIREIKGGSGSIGRSNDMPAWGQALEDGEIRSLVAYIRSFCEGDFYQTRSRSIANNAASTASINPAARSAPRSYRSPRRAPNARPMNLKAAAVIDTMMRRGTSGMAGFHRLAGVCRTWCSMGFAFLARLPVSVAVAPAPAPGLRRRSGSRRGNRRRTRRPCGRGSRRGGRRRRRGLAGCRSFGGRRP